MFVCWICLNVRSKRTHISSWENSLFHFKNNSKNFTFIIIICFFSTYSRRKFYYIKGFFNMKSSAFFLKKKEKKSMHTLGMKRALLKPVSSITSRNPKWIWSRYLCHLRSQSDSKFCNNIILVIVPKLKLRGGGGLLFEKW